MQQRQWSQQIGCVDVGNIQQGLLPISVHRPCQPHTQHSACGQGLVGADGQYMGQLLLRLLLWLWLWQRMLLYAAAVCASTLSAVAVVPVVLSSLSILHQ